MITALAVTVSVLTGTILFLIPRQEIFHALYEQQEMEKQTGMSAFEAELNYDCMIQQLMGEQEIIGMTTYPSSDDLRDKLYRLHKMYQCSKWLCGISILLATAGMLVLRKQKWYECLWIGGGISISIGIGTILPLWLIKPLRLVFFFSQYEEYLGYDLRLVEILPQNWAMDTWICGVGFITIIGLILILLSFGIRRAYKPHKF